ncbi:hypothetical protein [Corynebacterium sp.]|uniref:hypothetical protein n=1 Tax=Corynebacterium sp. TaxID=1720 RepID=UPI002A91646E|nr:hypothetical protein [Corynebacterium sp.]MDY5786565.1 hypothetical protein [Corynebacterium sp.]
MTLLSLADVHVRNLSVSLSVQPQERVALALAMVHDPQLSLADDPTASLDETRASEVMALFSSLEVTQVVAMHDFDLARQWASRVIGIRAGEVLFDVAAADVSADYVVHTLNAAGVTGRSHGLLRACTDRYHAGYTVGGSPRLGKVRLGGGGDIWYFSGRDCYWFRNRCRCCCTV